MPVADQESDGGRRSAGGISLQTLLIASVASVVTSYVVSRVWGPGTLIGAGATPVIVALVAESLRKPVQTVAATAQRVPAVQYVPLVRDRSRAQPDPGLADAPTRVTGSDDAPATRVAGEPRERPHAAPAPSVDPGYVAAVDADPLATPAQRPSPRWGLVLATAAAAFAIVVAVYTIPDLVAGKSIIDNGRATTLFGGHRSSSQRPASPTKTQTTTAPATVTKTAPAKTTTVPAPTTTQTAPTTATGPATTTQGPPPTTTAPNAPAPAPVPPTTTTAPPKATPPPVP